MRQLRYLRRRLSVLFAVSPCRRVDHRNPVYPGLHIKELLSLTETKLRELDVGVPRIMLYGCDHGSVVEECSQITLPL